MIENFIPTGHKNAVTRAQLVILTGQNDRKNRRQIEDAIKRGIPIVNNGDGYFRPDKSDKEDMRLARLYYMTETARIKAESDRLKALRDFIPIERKKRSAWQIEGQTDIFDFIGGEI